MVGTGQNCLFSDDGNNFALEWLEDLSEEGSMGGAIKVREQADEKALC